ncbi:B3 domain-containing transcription factor VRN1-like [Solanum dulcamara]|uniref:B3 domain-containing transcription factor VRN1-like n=1 Tax=Solanum dulcamara TaxID=45834 RepID=UPI0024864918|nr:B3 domain-containing transcription factor VRN1-like [Solanum dulcamara]
MVNKFRRQIDEASSISNISQPKFCKIIFCPHELCSLRIPEEFANRYCKNMLNPVYLEVPSGEVWEVEVQHSEGQIWLAEGWKDFSDYYSIRRGHFLMFGYNARSHFNVTIFDLSAAEIEYPTAETESDDSIDISDVVEHSSLNLSHDPLIQERKRERQEGEEEDDSPVEHQTNVIEEEESQRNVVSLVISEDCEEHEQQSNIVTSKSEAESNEEIADNYQRAKAFKSKNPFILSIMRPSYVSRPHTLYIPLKFARMYLMRNSGNIVLRVPGKGSWSVKCISRRNDAKVTCGWKAFVLDNKLKYGDVCVLEVINDTKLSLIDVSIFPLSRGI